MKKHGFVRYIWTKDASQANEALDNHLQAEAAAIKYGVRGLPDALWDRLEEERERAPSPAQGDLEDLMSLRQLAEPKGQSAKVQSPSAPAAASSPPPAPSKSSAAPLPSRRSSRSPYVS